jgi:nucleotide-binding universal stress UspA family protein
MRELLRTIVVAVSGSEASINAAKYAIAMARSYHTKVIAVYVVDTATLRELLLSRIFVEDESADYAQSLEQNGHRYLNYVEELGRKKGVEIEKVLRRGSIATEVVTVADDAKADLILLGGFEDKEIFRHALPREHREIMRHARCSVLVVKETDVEAIYRKI